MITISGIQNLVSTRFNVPIDQLLGSKQDRPTVRARQIAYWLAHQLTDKSSGQIGQAFDRDGSTIRQAVLMVNRLIKINDEWGLAAESLRVELTAVPDFRTDPGSDEILISNNGKYLEMLEQAA